MSSVEISWIISGSFLVLWFFFLLILKKYIFKNVGKLVLKTKWKFDDVLFQSAKLPLMILLVILGIFISLKIAPLNKRIETLSASVIKILSIAAIFIFLDRLIVAFTTHYKKEGGILASSYGIIKTIIHITIYGIAFLVILDSLNISITPMIASLGIGSVAVALALQDTLANLFAGVSIIADKSLNIGNYVEINSEIQGYIKKIGWRTTWIETIASETIVIPNSYLIKNVIKNFNKPEYSLWLPVNVGVSYESDLEKVERVTLDVAKKHFFDENEHRGYEPYLRFKKFNDFSIDFTVYIRVKNYADFIRVRHEFIKKLHKRYNEEGINIPFPITTVYFGNKLDTK